MFVLKASRLAFLLFDHITAQTLLYPNGLKEGLPVDKWRFYKIKKIGLTIMK